MKKSREFDNVLDECLERLLVKGETIEQCLAHYPEQAAELKPLLETAVAAKKVSAIQPRPEFRAKARYQFRLALQEAESKRSRPSFGWLPQWATVVTIVLVVLLAGSGTVAAAGNSMPDNPLYSVKLATEQVQSILTLSDIGKAELYVKLADRRVAEIIYMANKGNAQQVELITQRLDNHLVILASAAPALKAGEAPKVLAPLPVPAPSEETMLAPSEETVPIPSEEALPEEETMPAPSEETVLAPSEETVPAPTEETRDGEDVFVETNSWAKLRTTVAHYAINHQAALQAALEKSPESVKSALRQAIAVSEAGYEKALMALD